MSKLYWRYKKNGKWTWRPVPNMVHQKGKGILIPYLSGYKEEE